MDAYVNLVVVLVYNADYLLVTVARGDAHQACETPYAEVYVDDVVARFHLLQLLHSQRHLARTGGIGAQTVLVEAVEYLMVGEEAGLHRIVGKALVQGL